MLPIVEDIYFARKYLLVQNKNKIKSVQNNPVLRYWNFTISISQHDSANQRIVVGKQRFREIYSKEFHTKKFFKLFFHIILIIYFFTANQWLYFHQSTLNKKCFLKLCLNAKKFKRSTGSQKCNSRSPSNATIDKPRNWWQKISFSLRTFKKIDPWSPINSTVLSVWSNNLLFVQMTTSLRLLKLFFTFIRNIFSTQILFV